MRIVILTLDHIYSNKIVKELLLKYGKDIKLIIEPTQQIKGKTNFQAVFKYIKISGIYYVYTQLVKLVMFRLISKIYSIFSKNSGNKFFHYKVVAKKFTVPVLKIENINSELSGGIIKKYKPDLIVSVLFSQILKKKALSLPKLATINFHPAYLPYYKGISPIFWSLVNKEKYSGISVHYINEGIDTGGVIKQKKIKIYSKDTEDSLYWRSVSIGSRLLISVVDEFFKGLPGGKIKSDGSYYSFPTRDAVRKFCQAGHKFFILNEYLFKN